MSKIEFLDTPYQYFILTIDLNRLDKHELEMFYTPIYSNFLKHCSDIFNVSNREINIDQIFAPVLSVHCGCVDISSE